MATSKNILDFAFDLPRPGVMCTIVSVTGSHPQVVGAKMWVTPDDVMGTLGGGQFELRVIRAARSLLNARDATALEHYVLCREMNQCCGGKAQVFFEAAPARPRVHLFGAGHVGQAVADVLTGMPLKVHVVDAREEWAHRTSRDEQFTIHNTNPLEYARAHDWSAQDAACIFTHDHDLDFALVHHLLEADLGYLGLIGSRHKAKVFRARVADREPHRRDEILDRWDDVVDCPMGEKFASKNPKVIAVSIVAQLLRSWALPAPAGRDEAGRLLRSLERAEGR